MARPLGENMQREWNSEASASALWEALQVKKRDRNLGLQMLSDLATGGSTLAMMYVGCTLADGSVFSTEEDAKRGEEWLGKSAQAGSIEGRVQLALLYLSHKRWHEAEAELKALGQQGYSPAMHALAVRLYKGSMGRRSVSEAVDYLKRAASADHIFARGRLAWVCRKETLGFRECLVSYWNCIRDAPTSIWYIFRYRNSDRLRQIHIAWIALYVRC